MTSGTPVYGKVGDIGTQVILDAGTDITTATSVAIKVEKPVSGDTETWSGSVVESTKVSYSTGTGDFDEAGIYKVCCYVVMPSWTGHGDMVAFRIASIYEG